MQFHFDANHTLHIDSQAHELFAHYMPACFGNDEPEVLSSMLELAKRIQQRSLTDYQRSNHGYYVQLAADQQNVHLKALSILDLPEHFETDENGQIECFCELDDFIRLLEQWQEQHHA